MISRLRGEVVARSTAGVVLDVGGVGYLVNPTTSAHRMAKPGSEVVSAQAKRKRPKLNTS